MQVGSLVLFSGLKIQHYSKLWYRSQMRLASLVAVAVVQADSCSSDSTPSPGTSICYRCSPKKKNRKRNFFPPPLFFFCKRKYPHEKDGRKSEEGNHAIDHLREMPSVTRWETIVFNPFFSTKGDKQQSFCL